MRNEKAEKKRRKTCLWNFKKVSLSKLKLSMSKADPLGLPQTFCFYYCVIFRYARVHFVLAQIAYIMYSVKHPTLVNVNNRGMGRNIPSIVGVGEFKNVQST